MRRAANLHQDAIMTPEQAVIESDFRGPALLAFLKIVEKYYREPENHDDQ